MTDDEKKLAAVLRSMCGRCHNPNDQAYKYYGGRGIIVWRGWRNSSSKFIQWALAHGYRPGLDIDRIDNNGPYAPYNCHFIEHADNMRNTRRVRKITFDGRTQSIAQWARDLGIKEGTLLYRINNWPLEDALSSDKLIRKNPTFKKYEHNGVYYSLRELSELTGIRQNNLNMRLNKYGWTVERIFKECGMVGKD